MKTLLRSFLTPCGRIGILGFWWRQLLLAALLYPCCNVSAYSGVKMFGEGITPVMYLIPSLLAQCFAPTCLSSAYGAGEGAIYGYYCELRHHAPTGFELYPGIPALFCYLVALLAAWSSLALMLRRLRDTRVGLWALPLCLTLCWGLPMPLCEGISDFETCFPESLQIAAFGIPLIASLILALLPSRKTL